MAYRNNFLTNVHNNKLICGLSFSKGDETHRDWQQSKIFGSCFWCLGTLVGRAWGPELNLAGRKNLVLAGRMQQLCLDWILLCSETWHGRPLQPLQQSQWIATNYSNCIWLQIKRKGCKKMEEINYWSCSFSSLY